MKCHNDVVNTMDNNYMLKNLIITGGNDCRINVIDLNAKKLSLFNNKIIHNGPVNCLKWDNKRLSNKP